MKQVLGKKLYSVGETAELLGVTEASVYNYTKRGQLKQTKIGGRKFFSEDSLKAFVSEH